MGRSAKLRKRVPKKTATTEPKAVASPVQPAKKRAGLKSKVKAKPGTKKDHILGDADYVTLMLGGRRKAAEEALKLPAEES